VSIGYCGDSVAKDYTVLKEEFPMKTEEKEEEKSLTFKFPLSMYQALEELASQKGGSFAVALGDAIAFSQWAKEVQAKGGKILVEQNGKILEVQHF
jgi:hypothetical protein